MTKKQKEEPKSQKEVEKASQEIGFEMLDRKSEKELDRINGILEIRRKYKK